jgi:hypothetical protein
MNLRKRDVAKITKVLEDNTSILDSWDALELYAFAEVIRQAADKREAEEQNIVRLCNTGN